MSTAKRVAEHKKYLVVTCVIFSIYTVLLLFPEVWLLINSGKEVVEFSESSWAWPKSFKFSNYAYMFTNENYNMAEAFGNSILYCFTVPTAGIISTTFAAYALSKFDFRGKKALYFIHILPMLVCITGSSSALWIFFNDLNLYNNPFSLIWAGAGGTGMNFLLVYSVFKNVSRTYMEAAEIDGASDFTVFVKIMIPQALGIIGTLWMLGFIGSWNEYASYELYTPNYKTVSTVLTSIQRNITEGGYQDYPKFFAAIVISIVPVVAIFLVFQKQIMQMSLGGGIKG